MTWVTGQRAALSVGGPVAALYGSGRAMQLGKDLRIPLDNHAFFVMKVWQDAAP